MNSPFSQLNEDINEEESLIVEVDLELIAQLNSLLTKIIECLKANLFAEVLEVCECWWAMARSSESCEFY